VKRSISASVLVLIVIGVGASRPALGQTQTDLAGYVGRLNAAIAALREPGAEPAQAIADARAALGLPLVVEQADGSTMLVTDDALIGSGADGEDADAVRALIDRLETAVEEASRASERQAPDRAQVDEAIAAAYGGEPAGPSWWERVLGRIGQAIGWLLEHTLGALARSPAGSVVGWLVVLAIGVAVVVLLQRVAPGIVPDARTGDGGGDLAIVDWRRVADEALARDDMNGAVHALYHVLVGTLAYRGVVREAPSLTAGECRGAVRAERPQLANPIDRATAAFERVAYGNQDADPDDVDALRAAEQAVRRA
jgi:hypothetical protein